MFLSLWTCDYALMLFMYNQYVSTYLLMITICTCYCAIFRSSSLLQNSMKFWPTILWMRVDYGRRNSLNSHWSFLNFYLKQFKSNWCLKEIHMEMFRCLMVLLCHAWCVYLAQDAIWLGVDANAVYSHLGCQDRNGENAYSNGWNWVREEKARRKIQRRI